MCLYEKMLYGDKIGPSPNEGLKCEKHSMKLFLEKYMKRHDLYNKI